MSEQHDRIRHDLTAAFLEELQSVASRRASIAATVLPVEHVALMLSEISTNMLCGALVYVAQNADHDANLPNKLADIISSIANTVAQRRPKIIKVAAALNAGADPNAAMRAAV